MIGAMDVYTDCVAGGMDVYTILVIGAMDVRSWQMFAAV